MQKLFDLLCHYSFVHVMSRKKKIALKIEMFCVEIIILFLIGVAKRFLKNVSETAAM